MRHFLKFVALALMAVIAFGACTPTATPTPSNASANAGGDSAQQVSNRYLFLDSYANW